MSIETIVKQLTDERKRIDAALAALQGNPDEVQAPAASEPPQPSHSSPSGTQGHRNSVRRMSPETRKKISRTMKSRWATNRRKSTRPLSQEVKDKIAESQKKRWAAHKAAAEQATPAAAAA